MDLIQQGLAWQAAQLKKSAGQPVTYQRGAQSASLTATIGQTAFKTEDLPRGGVKIEHSDVDFIFTAADLTAAGICLPPQMNDTVLFGGVTYGLFHPPGELPYKIDGYGIEVTVHTKRI